MAAAWAAGAVAAVALTGCGDVRREAAAADNTAEVCAEVRAVTLRHMSGQSPEGRAYQELITERYTGGMDPADADGRAVERAYLDAVGRDVRGAGDRATRAQTRAAVIDVAGVLSNPGEGGTERFDAVMSAFTAMCGGPALTRPS